MHAVPLSFPDLFCSVIINRISKSRIFPAKTVLGSLPAPRVTAFSSKGPNALTPEILKVNFHNIMIFNVLPGLCSYH